jgi:hypothetical protein
MELALCYSLAPRMLSLLLDVCKICSTLSYIIFKDDAIQKVLVIMYREQIVAKKVFTLTNYRFDLILKSIAVHLFLFCPMRYKL